MKKRILSLLLVLCLMAGLTCTSAFAAEKPFYVALGDSIAAGYGLEGYQNVSGTPGKLVYTVPESCFAKRIAAEKGYELLNLAVSGDDTDKLLSRMKTAQYADPLKRADVITLTIGSNDLLVKVLDLIQTKYLPGTTDHAVMATPGSGGLLDGDVTEMTATLQSVNDYLNSPEVAGILAAAVETFKTNWDTIVDTLKSWNPDVKLIVTNYYHPYAMLDLNLGTLNLNLGTLGMKYLGQMNAHVKDNPRSGKCYTVVDVTGTGTNVKLDLSALMTAYLGGTADLRSAVNLDPHPDPAGHAYIAGQILAAMDAAEKAAATAAAGTFSDVTAGVWYAAPVRFAAEQGLVLGDGTGRFHPMDHMSLAQYLTLLYRVTRTLAPATVPEKATAGANWTEAAQYMNAALMQGTYADLNADMTRYEMADITAAGLKLLVSATGKTMHTRETHGFADVTDNTAVQYLESVYGLDGSPQPDGSYLYRGDDSISRAEVSQALYNMLTKSLA